jgi:hypothetical protein
MDFSVCKSITFIKGRLKFGTQKNSSPFPSVIIVFGPSVLGNQVMPLLSMSNK